MRIEQYRALCQQSSSSSSHGLRVLPSSPGTCRKRSGTCSHSQRHRGKSTGSELYIHGTDQGQALVPRSRSVRPSSHVSGRCDFGAPRPTHSKFLQPRHLSLCRQVTSTMAAQITSRSLALVGAQTPSILQCGRWVLVGSQKGRRRSIQAGCCR